MLVHEEKMPRQHWKKGIVTNLIQGKDGKARGAEVRTPNSRVIRRPVNRLYPIETFRDIEFSILHIFC